jgi:V-type H+-transporting ATPase subunit d
VRKIWLNEFYDFCEVNLPETSREVMVDYLKFEADCQTIQIINNSFVVGGMNNAAVNETERRKFMPRIGYLYPDRQEKLSNVSDMRTLQIALDGSPYEKLLARVSSGDDRNEAESANVTIDDVMLEEASRRYSIGFEGGFHLGCFFSFMKLREQEIKNLTWLAELIQLGFSRNAAGWNKFISPFQYHLNDNLAK